MKTKVLLIDVQPKRETTYLDKFCLLGETLSGEILVVLNVLINPKTRHIRTMNNFVQQQYIHFFIFTWLRTIIGARGGFGVQKTSLAYIKVQPAVVSLLFTESQNLR